MIDNQTTFNFTQPKYRMFSENLNENLVYMFGQKGFLYHKPKVLGMRAMRVFDEGWNSMLIDEGGIWGKGSNGYVIGNRMASNVSRYKSGYDYRTDLDLIQEVYKYTPAPEFVIHIGLRENTVSFLKKKTTISTCFRRKKIYSKLSIYSFTLTDNLFRAPFL